MNKVKQKINKNKVVIFGERVDETFNDTQETFIC